MNDESDPFDPSADAADGDDARADGGPDSSTVGNCLACGATLAPPHRFCTACGQRVDDGSDDADGAGDADGSDAAVDAAAGEETVGLTAAGVGRGVSAEQQAAEQARVPPASGLSATRRCGSCGAVNVHHRVLCGACGTDLDGDDAATVTPPSGPALVSHDRPLAGSRGDERHGVGWWWLAVAVATVGVVIGGLVISGVGPFADEPTVLDPVAYPQDRYPDQPQRLELASVATLTTREPAAERSFSPQAMVDGDLGTAWHGDADALPDTAREKLDLHIEQPAWVTDLVLANGDHADADRYTSAGRLHRVDLQFDGGQVVRATLLDIGTDLQRIHLDEPMLTTAVRVEVLEVLAGEQHRGPAVSQLEVRGMPADDADAALAEQRAEQRPAAGAVTLTSGRPTLPLPGRVGG